MNEYTQHILRRRYKKDRSRTGYARFLTGEFDLDIDIDIDFAAANLTGMGTSERLGCVM